VLDVVEDERLAGAGPLRQPHDGAELDVPVDLGVDFGELALRLERRNPAAQVAEGDGLSFGGDILGAGLEHAGPIACATKTRWTPSPACGGGLGWGNASTILGAWPPPLPPPPPGGGGGGARARRPRPGRR